MEPMINQVVILSTAVGSAVKDVYQLTFIIEKTKLFNLTCFIRGTYSLPQ